MARSKLGTWRTFVECGALQVLNMACCKRGTSHAAILERGALQAQKVAHCKP